VRDSLFSPLWYRVANQHPRLRADVRVERHDSRGVNWYLLVNETTSRQFRISEKAYQVLGRCDGNRSVQQVWDRLLEELGDGAPTQHEVVAMLSQLDQHGVLSYDGLPDVAALVKERAQRVQRRRRGFLNPLALQIPLGDPAPLLDRLQPLGRVVFQPFTLVVWIAAVVAALAAAAVNWPALSVHAALYMNTPKYLLIGWLAFPLIKALHELAHGLAVRHWGGEVHSAGLTLFVLTPAPYVDASASAAFRARYQRCVVAAVGIMVELTLAAAALLVWLNVEPGVIRDVAFVTLFTASISTVLFNGNPLLKFDAYYAMCDALDLPNLGPRSSAYWAERLQRLALGVNARRALEPAPGERKWLIAYAPLSAAYRLLVCGFVVVWAGGHSLVLGALTGCYVLATLVVKPLYRAMHGLVATPPEKLRWRARTVAAGVTLGAVLLLGVMPFPFHTSARAVVWLPDEAQVRTAIDGFITDIVVGDGERVEPGELLLVMRDPLLHARRAQIASQREQIHADVAATLSREEARTRDFELEIARIDGEVRDLDERIASLELRAQVAGTFVLPRQNDLPGAFVSRGSTLGYILTGGAVSLRAAVPEHDAALVRERTRGVEVRLAERSGAILEASVVRDVPSSTRELPSAALSDRGGGPYFARADDKDGVRIGEPIVLVDLKVPAAPLQRVGGRAWVRFDHGAEPLGQQWYRRGRQLLLQHFNPTG
jgi:putative peptide zinc metalloprotease protein